MTARFDLSVSALVLVSLSIVGALAPTPAHAQAPNIRVGDEAARGTSVRRGRATTTIDAPIDQVWAIVRDYGRYDDFMPHFRASRVLNARGARALVYFEVAILHDTATLWANLMMRATEAEDGTKRIVARQQRGNMSRFEASWDLRPREDGGTDVTFRLMVDPGLPVPNGLVNEENRRFARKGLRNLVYRVAARMERTRRQP